jgi:3'-phosphoadenosine 5'-phosphosulfate sulfotransferase (PAPS reductase)/FAD synthetase
MQAVQFIPTQELLPSPVSGYQGHYSGIVAKAEKAIERIGELIDDGYVLQCACSFGKDSSVVLVLMLEAIRRRVEAGLTLQTCYVSHSNTEVENPSMSTYTDGMISELQGYCARHHLPVEVMYVTPSVTASFAYATVGRGKLPVFAGASRACSVDWKLRPQQKAIRELLGTLQNPGELVTLVGTRFSESAVRGANMRERGDSAMDLVKKDEGFFSLAVIADWELTDVWELLMACEARRNGPYRTYVEDFSWCLELYRDANEGTCAIITGDGGNKAACGSRFGCATCSVTGEKDKSMEAMIQSAPDKHGHLKGINQFRNFLVKTRGDMSRREILGRKVSKAGYFGVAPTSYSAEMRRDMLRYLLTLDIEEEERAEEFDAKMFRGEVEDTEANRSLRGITFQFITPKKLLSIDFAWSLCFGFDHAFPALTEWYEIRVLGKRYPVPDIIPAKDKVPAMCWYPLAEGTGPAFEMGLQDVDLAEYNQERFPSRPPMRTIRDRYLGKPRKVVYYEEADEMEIDAMEATLFVDSFDDELYFMAKTFSAIEGAKLYLNRGIIKLGRGKAADYDELARRAQFWTRLKSMIGDTDIEAYLQSHSIATSAHDELLKAMEDDPEEEQPFTMSLF